MQKVGDNYYHCDLSVVSDGSLNLAAFDKEYIQYFTKWKLPRRASTKSKSRKAKVDKVDDILNDFNINSQ